MTDTDKINIVSSQVGFELSSFQMDACSKSSTLLVNSHVDSRLFKATPDVDHPPFIHATYFCLVDTMLHDNPDFVVDRVQIWDIWMPQVPSSGIKSGVSTQPGHPSVDRHNEYWRSSRSPLGKKRRVLRNSGCWHNGIGDG